MNCCGFFKLIWSLKKAEKRGLGIIIRLKITLLIKGLDILFQLTQIIKFERQKKIVFSGFIVNEIWTS